jgi:hypothetical protein
MMLWVSILTFFGALVAVFAPRIIMRDQLYPFTSLAFLRLQS